MEKARFLLMHQENLGSTNIEAKEHPPLSPHGSLFYKLYFIRLLSECWPYHLLTLLHTSRAMWEEEKAVYDQLHRLSDDNWVGVKVNGYK